MQAAVLIAIAARRRHDDEMRVGTAGQLDEFLDDASAFGLTAADDHERAFGRPVFGSVLNLRRLRRLLARWHAESFRR